MKNWSCVCYNNLLSSRLNSISPTLTKPISPRPREGLRINQPGIFYRLLFHFEQRSACVCMCVRARMCECVFTHVRFAKGPSSARFRASAATSTFSTTRVGGFPRSSASSTLSAFLFFPSFLFSFLTLQTNARFSKRSIFTTLEWLDLPTPIVDLSTSGDFSSIMQRHSSNQLRQGRAFLANARFACFSGQDTIWAIDHSYSNSNGVTIKKIMSILIGNRTLNTSENRFAEWKSP